MMTVKIVIFPEKNRIFNKPGKWSNYGKITEFKFYLLENTFLFFRIFILLLRNFPLK